jgi:uncharacterized protein YeaO (DUF488 family)
VRDGLRERPIRGRGGAEEDRRLAIAIRVVRLGSPRLPREGTRFGTVRRPPRGVKKADYARRDYYDVWLPELAPSAPVVSWAHAGEWTEARWRKYVRQYLREMRAQRRLIAVLAALSRQADFSIGCYCEDATFCHRSLLAGLLRDAGALIE